jgi:sulfur carrier protein ThiS
MQLYLGGYLDYYNPERGNWLEVKLSQPSQLGKVLTELGIPMSEVHLVVLNGQLVDISKAIVSEEDELKLFPAVGGG